MKIDDKTYEVTVGDLQARLIIASVDGEDFEVWPGRNDYPDKFYTKLLQRPASRLHLQTEQATSPSESHLKMVHAPLPGVIVDIKGDRRRTGGLRPRIMRVGSYEDEECYSCQPRGQD